MTGRVWLLFVIEDEDGGSFFGMRKMRSCCFSRWDDGGGRSFGWKIGYRRVVKMREDEVTNRRINVVEVANHNFHWSMTWTGYMCSKQT